MYWGKIAHLCLTPLPFGIICGDMSCTILVNQNLLRKLSCMELS